MALKKLTFDVTDADTIAASASVGAFVRSSDGTLIDHQNVNSENWLNVASLLYDDSGAPINSSNPLPVDVTGGVNVEVDLSHVDDSVALGDGTNLLTSTTVGADIGLDVNLINASIAVTATDLDIRDLVYTSDSVTAYQGGTWDIGTLTSITNDVNIADGGNSITVDAVDLDIRDLTAASDSVAAWLADGAGTALTSTLVGSDQALDVNVVQISDPALANVAIATAQNALDAANTAEDAVASPLSNRKYLFITNIGNKTIYIGPSGVSDSDGYPIHRDDEVILRAGSAIDIEWVGSNTNQKIATLELS